MLSEWIGNIATSEVMFSNATVLLRDYSLAEQVQEMRRYTTHAVVHRWALHFYGAQFATKLYQLAVVTVGWAIPGDAAYHCSAVQC
jgi:hypothetical protein